MTLRIPLDLHEYDAELVRHMRAYYDGMHGEQKIRLRRAVRELPMDAIYLSVLIVVSLLNIINIHHGATVGTLWLIVIVWCVFRLHKVCNEARLFALAGIPPAVPKIVPSNRFQGQMTRDSVPGVP